MDTEEGRGKMRVEERLGTGEGKRRMGDLGEETKSGTDKKWNEERM